MNKSLKNAIKSIQDAIQASKDKHQAIEILRDAIYRVSSQSAMPIDRVRWVSIKDVQPNDYNPNRVASKELGLLYVSIKHDGITQPVVTIYDPEREKYIIVDGFHRYFICKSKADIRAKTHDMIPVVVIDKPINERKASTIRHNRARGEHTVTGMSNLVFELLDNGWEDADICNHLGLEPEELLKLKHITGFSALFNNAEYSKAWETKRMIRFRLNHQKDNAGGKNT